MAPTYFANIFQITNSYFSTHSYRISSVSMLFLSLLFSSLFFTSLPVLPLNGLLITCSCYVYVWGGGGAGRGRLRILFQGVVIPISYQSSFTNLTKIMLERITIAKDQQYQWIREVLWDQDWVIQWYWAGGNLRINYYFQFSLLSIYSQALN